MNSINDIYSYNSCMSHTNLYEDKHINLMFKLNNLEFLR